MAIFKSIISGFSNIALQIMLIIIIGVGAIRVATGVISIGSLSAFIMYVMLVLTPAAMLGGVLASIMRDWELIRGLKLLWNFR